MNPLTRVKKGPLFPLTWLILLSLSLSPGHFDPTTERFTRYRQPEERIGVYGGVWHLVEELAKGFEERELMALVVQYMEKHR